MNKLSLLVICSVLFCSGCAYHSSPSREDKNNSLGHVDLIADITPQGRATNIRTLYATNPEFQNIAIKFLKHNHYRPAVKNGIPITEYNHKVHVDFTPDQ
ncbi:energy transducer TonB [Swingsia samuiensis]|uniref:energy transducer TonB n=1 Tax=Swingsia samuiensis TaxID=1293412 RepID=UPI0015E8954E